MELVAERSGGLLLCEGGPTLLGELARAGLVDELFLTVAPQLAGRDDAHRRLGLVEGFAATPEEAPKLELHSLRRAREHLFLRYRRAGASAGQLAGGGVVCQPQSSIARSSAARPSARTSRGGCGRPRRAARRT